MTTARRADGALLFVTLLWGLTFPLIKGALNDAPPFSFLALRFAIASTALFAALRLRIPPRPVWPAGLVLCVPLVLSYYAQTAGLVHTSATRSAFITGLSVVLVPMLYPALTRRLPGLWPTIGAAVAAAGLYLITAPESGGLNRGDVMTLFCALGYALYIIVLEIVSRRHAYRDLLAMQVLVMAVVFAPAAVLEGGPARWTGSLWGAVLGTGAIFAATMYLQTRFQRDTTATRAAVIFAAEPVFASGFAFLLLGETLAPLQWLGGGLILLAIVLAEKR